MEFQSDYSEIGGKRGIDGKIFTSYKKKSAESFDPDNARLPSANAQPFKFSYKKSLSSIAHRVAKKVLL